MDALMTHTYPAYKIADLDELPISEYLALYDKINMIHFYEALYRKIADNSTVETLLEGAGLRKSSIELWLEEEDDNPN